MMIIMMISDSLVTLPTFVLEGMSEQTNLRMFITAIGCLCAHGIRRAEYGESGNRANERKRLNAARVLSRPRRRHGAWLESWTWTWPMWLAADRVAG